MASVFISTPSEIVLIDSRTRSGTVTLPNTNQIAYRIVSFKDQYGSFSNSTMTLSTQTGETFDDGTTTKTFSNAFTSINLYATPSRWMVMNATQTVQQTISSLITNQIIFGTGAGWVQFGPVQATILSSIQQTTALGLFSSIGINCNAPGYVLNANGFSQLSTNRFPATIGRKNILWAASDTAALTGAYYGQEIQSGEFRNTVDVQTNRISFGWTNAANTFSEWARFTNQRLGVNPGGVTPQCTLDIVSSYTAASAGSPGTGTIASFTTNIPGTVAQRVAIDLGAQARTVGNFGGIYKYRIASLNTTGGGGADFMIGAQSIAPDTYNLDGTEFNRFYITNTGNVGINTSTPSVRLDVAGNALISSLGLSIAPSGTFPLNVQGPGIQVNGGGLFLTSTNNVNFNTLAQWFGPTTGLNFAGFGSYVRDLTQRANIGIVAVNNTNTATLMFISSGGNVGIGTLAPSNYRLNIRGTGTSNGLITWHAAGNDIPFVGWGYDETADALIFSRNVGTNNFNNVSTVVFARVSGNVGINVGGAPGTTLDVGGIARSLSTVTSSVTLGLGAGWVQANALQAIAVSSIQMNSALAYMSSLYVGSTTLVTPGYTAWFNGITRAQRLIVGNTSSFTIPVATWDLQMVRGQAAAQPLATTWLVTSDKRIKENIVSADLDRCYNDLKNVPLRRYAYASSFFELVDGTDRHVLGFVAQEVSTIIPKAVVVGEGYGYSNFNYLNIDQLNMSLYGAVKKTILDKEILESTVKGQRVELETLRGTTTLILSTLEGLQGR